MPARRMLCLFLSVSFSGCATTLPADLPAVPVLPAELRQVETDAKSPPAINVLNPNAIPRVPRMTMVFEEALPIDLPTVLRLVNSNSPAIAIARAKVQEASTRTKQAEILWLPDVAIGPTYFHSDGQTQNQSGNVFSVSRGNLFAAGGITLGLDISEALYRPLVERQQQASTEFRSQSVLLGSELDAVLAYFDLLQIHAQVAINAETIHRVEDLLIEAEKATIAKREVARGNVERLKVELYLRNQERIDLKGKTGVVSARLGKLLLLPPTVKLVPADAAVTPVTLVDATANLESLIAIGLANHPQPAANRAALAAANERIRLAKQGPLIPKVALTNQVGSFGGGLNSDLQNFDARNVLSLQVYWGLRNLGCGNRNEVAAQRALADQSRYAVLEEDARLAAEITEAAAISAARAESLGFTRDAYKEAITNFGIISDGAFGALDAPKFFDSVRPLQAIQSINSAWLDYLTAVIEYNRAQYRLFTALGQPPRSAESK